MPRACHRERWRDEDALRPGSMPVGRPEKYNPACLSNQFQRQPVAGHSEMGEHSSIAKGARTRSAARSGRASCREITVAARAGGGDLSANPRLRLAVDKAKAANMPADRVKYNIDKATGNAEGVSYGGDPLRGLRHWRRGHHRATP